MSEKDQREITYILNQKDAAYNATFERREAAYELWQLYQNRQDYGNKKEWQSKIFVPKVFMSIEQATSVVKRAILQPRRLFKLEPIDPNDEIAVQNRGAVEELLKRAIKDSNFAATYAEMIKEGFLVGLGVPKVFWEDGLRYANVSTTQSYIDPDYQVGPLNNPQFIIEEKEMDLAELKELAQRVNRDAGRSVYNMREINSIKSDGEGFERKERERLRKGLQHHVEVDRRVNILEFWGDIIDPQTNKVKKNQLRIVANKRNMIRSQDNPFIHGRLPYVPTTPIPYPHRGSWGVSLVEPIAKMQYAYNNIINLSIDNLNFSVNKVYQYQPSNLVNPRSLTRLYPGKLVATHNSSDAIKEVRTSNIGQDSFAAMGLLQSEIQKGTAVTEFLMGTAGGSKTATEAELKTAQAQGIFDTMARGIEINSLAPIIEMSFDLMAQFGQIPQGLRGKYKFEVGGLSLLLVRREQTERVQAVLGLALQSQTIQSMTDIRKLYEKYLSLLNLDDVFSTEEQGPNQDQEQQIGQDAKEQAKKQVSGMSDEEILAAAEQMGI
jgi:hypothetical protein